MKCAILLSRFISWEVYKIMHKRAIEDYIDKINELYIMTRKKYIKQTDTGYVTISGSYDKPYVLIDWVLARHLRKEITIGVFSGQYLTKVIGFDVDTKDESATMTRDLVSTLTDTFGMSRESLLVTFSGSKGYHVDLFLDKAMSLKKANAFYKMVLNELNFSETEVELRPTSNQGYKLPLSVHLKSKKYMNIVDMYTLENISDDALFNVIPEDSEYVLDVIDENNTEFVNVGENELLLDNDTAYELEDVIDGLSPFIPKDYRQSAQEILKAKSLLYEGSRHKTTLFLSIYLREEGYAYNESVKILSEIINNTFQEKRSLIDHNTSIEHALYEVKRICLIVYEKKYSIRGRKAQKIRLYKEDIVNALKPKRKELKKLLFSMICHSKLYAKDDGSFYMAYSVMTNMGNTANRSRLYDFTDRLEKGGFIEVIRRGKRKDKRLLNEVNIYRVNNIEQAFREGNYIELDSINVDDWARVATELVDEKELKTMVSAKVFYSTFKSYYSTKKAS